MKLDIDITPEQYRIVKDIINRFLPNTCKVWVFGSRAKDTAQDYSDLDLALDAGKEVDYDTIRQLKLAFEESRLPYTVDVVDLHSVEPYFKEIIDSQKVVFPLNRSLSDRDSDCIEGKRNVPQLRFPGFGASTGSATEWVEKRLGKITRKVSNKNKENISYPIYSINNKEGFVEQSQQFEGVDSNERGYDISMYKIIEKNTFAYNPARINVGSIGYSGNLNKIIISSLYVCFRSTEQIYDPFIYIYFKSFQFNKSVLRNTEGGVRDYLFYDNFSHIKFCFPSLPEQKKIADFLTTVDDKIQSLTQKKEALTQYKKGLLQKLFPSSKKGGFDTSTSSARALSPRASTSARSLSDRDSDCIEGKGNVPELRFPGFSTSTSSARALSPRASTSARSLSDRDSDCIEGKGNVPELRFPGFSGEWVEKRIKDFGYFYYGKSAPKWSIKKGAKTPCIRYGELYTKFNVVVDKIYSYTNISTENLKFSKGGEVLVPRVGEDPKDFAKCCYLPFKDVAIGEMISVFNTKENGLFISCYFNTLYKEFGKMVEGASVSNLYFRYLEKIKLHLPSLPEQKKIADFLTTVDNKITQVDQQIEKTTQFKKGLLQQMFV